MLNFLLSLLTFALGIGGFLHHPAHSPAVTPGEIVERFEEYVGPLEAPEGNPVELFQNGQENAPESVPTGVPQSDEQTGQPENSTAQELAANPDTTKVAAYNTSSDKVIASVAAVAVEKAPPLEPNSSEAPDPEPTPTDPPPIPQPIEPPPTDVPPLDPCKSLPGDRKLMRPDILPCPLLHSAD